ARPDLRAGEREVDPPRPVLQPDRTGRSSDHGAASHRAEDARQVEPCAHEDLHFGPDDEGVELAIRIPVRRRFLEAPGVPYEFDRIIERGGLINAGRATERLRI